MRKLLLVAVALSLSALSLSAQARVVDPFVHGVPHRLVPGVALLKLEGIRAEELLLSQQPKNAHAKNALANLSARTGVDVTLIRPVVLGWAFVDVRARASKVIPTEQQTLALIRTLALDEAVLAVSEDKWMRPLLTPNDPGFVAMWHFDVIGAQAAWDVTQGTSSQRIGIIDTGILRSHEDVGDRAIAGFDFISDPGQGNDGNGRDSEFNDAGDACGGPASFHGTHVAGTIGATADNGTGVVGMNWRAGLVIARALGACGGDLLDIGEAAVWLAGGAVDNVPAVGANKVSVMNLSLGSDDACSSFEQDVVSFVDGEGVVFVAASGNNGGAVGSPANCLGAVTVAAHRADRSLASYSSFGDAVEIVAPGGDLSFQQEDGVLSTIGPSADLYAFQQGTSMAAPHVAGAISLIQAIDSTLTRNEIVSLLQETGAACAGCGSKKAMLIDAALQAIGTSNPPPPPPPDPEDDDFEENDSFDAAKNELGCGDDASLFSSFADQDWFIVETLPGQQIDIAISSSNGADLDLYALTDLSDDGVVAFSETETGEESIHIEADGTPLHILVQPFQTATGPYTMTIACVGGEGEGGAVPVEPDPIGPDPSAVEDALEDNDTIDTASELFCDEEKVLTARDDDFFVVAVREGDTLGALVTSAGLALDVVILAPDGDVLAEGSDTELARTDQLAEGSYIVRVAPADDDSFGVYRLRAACQAPQRAGGNPSAQGGCASPGSSAPPVATALVILLTLRCRRRCRCR
jgi:serine protease